MSIIGEMYEEEIWETRKALKDKMEAFLVYLNQKMDSCNDAYFQIWNIIEEFKEKFADEIRGND